MRRAILLFALIAPLVTVALWSSSVVAAVGVLFMSHMLVLYPTLRPTAQWLGPVVTSFETSEKHVWLTIDDGPDGRDTPRILDLLDAYQARATFFVKGNHVRQFQAETVEILRRGHALGNHSMTHPSGTFWCLPPPLIAAEIDRCSAEIERATGQRTSLFRAPVGMKNPFVHPHLRRRGMKLIGWSSRGFDGIRTDTKAVVEAILKDVRPGAVILAHEGRYDHQGNSVNYGMIEQIVRRLSGQGYSFVIPTEECFVYGRRKTKR